MLLSKNTQQKKVGILVQIILMAFCLINSATAQQEFLKEETDENPVLPVCRILSLSGGGSKGSYEVGSLHEILTTLQAPNNQYDVITGVSAGSINAAGFSLFGKGEEHTAATYMLDIWRSLENRKIWQLWPNASKYNPIHGLLYESGFLDNSPLHDFLISIMNGRHVQKRTIVSAIDANTGAYIPFNLFKMEPNKEIIVAAVMGSAAVPFIFPPKSMKEFNLDSLLIDGGSTWNNNMVSGIQECYALPGITHPKQITLDIIIMEPHDVTPIQLSKTSEKHSKFSIWPDTIRNYQRKNGIKKYYQKMDDIREFIRANPEVNYRYFVQPEKQLLPEYDILEFGPKYTEPMIQKGMSDAKKVIALGEGVSFQQFLDN